VRQSSLKAERSGSSNGKRLFRGARSGNFKSWPDYEPNEHVGQLLGADLLVQVGIHEVMGQTGLRVLVCDATLARGSASNRNG